MKSKNIKESDLKRMYLDEGMTQVEIGDWYGVSDATIGRRMNEFGIEARFRYDVNQDFFKTWTKESAWVYGWVIGDGWCSGSNRLGFNLGIKDKEVLYKFKEVMESEHHVKDYIGGFGQVSQLQIGSMEMINDLRKLSYENIPEWHRSDGIRGFFEAEGCVFLHVVKRGVGYEYIQTNFAQKDTTVLQWIWDVLRDEGVVEGGHLSKNQLMFSESDSVSLYHYMYDDCGELYLDRKKSRFEELMARRGYL